jgi:hypothetical protein
METINNFDLKQLTRQQKAVSNAIVDMRSSGSEDIVMPFLVLSLAGFAKYTNFLYNYS